MKIPSKEELERFSDEAGKLLARRETAGTPVARRHLDRFEVLKAEARRDDSAQPAYVTVTAGER
jgi:hypothetical protein